MTLGGRWALLALGSYATEQLCPQSDVDVLLLHDGSADREAVAAAADAFWYPLWDRGVVLGHAVRTPREALTLAGRDVPALTSLLEVRVVIGDEGLAGEVVQGARSLVMRRRSSFVETLATAAASRSERPGAVAEMLEPNLKDGAGGLRDLRALEWAGWSLGEPGGLAALVTGGYLRPSDPSILVDARSRLLEARGALHEVTGSASDLLTLQEQDEVARRLGISDADALLHELALTGRLVTWIAGDVWRRFESAGHGPAGRVARRDRVIGEGVVLREGVVTLTTDTTIDAAVVLRVAEAAARLRTSVARSSLERMRTLDGARWDHATRASFVALLSAGRDAIPVLEALDQVDVLSALIPEWRYVRARPQRNPYHRHMVDRHLLETVARCAALLHEPGFDGDVARRTRPELLLLSALLHDVGKGLDGDHSEAGATAARGIVGRIGLDDHSADVVGWLVRHHLLLAATATRRDLDDEATVTRFTAVVGDTERLDLLYVLTIGDSQATGPAAWSVPKARLVHRLFVEADGFLRRQVLTSKHAEVRRSVLGAHRSLLANRGVTFAWSNRDDDLIECAVAAPDRLGLLATVTGVLALRGFDVRSASVYGDDSGMALEVYRGIDRFGRLDDHGRADIEREIRAALEGELSVRDGLEERLRRYPHPPELRMEQVRVEFDLEASATATVVEVHAPDQVGLLARVAAVFVDLGFDVTAALVSTLGAHVIDVFYLRDSDGEKATDRRALDRLRATLVARLAADTLV